MESKALGAGPQHKMIQTHPHSGVDSLRFGGLQGIQTLVVDGVGMDELDGQRAAWQIMRHATRDENSYYHEWEGEGKDNQSPPQINIQGSVFERCVPCVFSAGELIVW